MSYSAPMYPGGPYPPPSGPSFGPSHGHVQVSYRRPPNFLQRLGGSVIGSFVGVLVVVGACVLIFWNEGRGIHTYDMLLEARDVCNPMRSPNEAYVTLDNKLIYVSGRISTVEPLQDPTYGVIRSSARLRRKVEMYQWIEETETREFKESDGSIRTERRYTYNTMWKSHLVDSNRFDDRRFHDNPKEMPVSDAEWTAVTRIGEFTLSKEAMEKVNNWKAVLLDQATLNLQVYNNKIYFGGNPHSPQVGDVRVFYEYAGDTTPGQEDEVSVVGRQSPGAVITTFRTPSGYDVLFLYMEGLSMDEVFSREHASNKVLTWAIRGVGFVLLFVGLNMIAGIVTTLFDWLPVVRELVALGVWLLAVVLSTFLTLVTIALAWIRYRPIYGLAVLVGACLPLIVPKLREILSGKRKNN